MSIKWTEEEENYIFSFVEDEYSSYTYEEMASDLDCEGISPIYRSPEAIRKFIARKDYMRPISEEDFRPVTLTEKDLTELDTKKKGPKILLFDIETLPLVAYTWGIWKQNISDYQIIQDWCILSWSAKWLFDSTVDGDILTSEEAINRDDERITRSLWDYINEADIIVAHNGDDFDIKKINSRFFKYGLNPPSPYVTVDTLKQSRKCFGHTSHKLDYLSKLFSNSEKLKTGFGLWVACDNGEQWALDKMLNYNKHDTDLLEDIFIQMIPWMTSLPNFALYTDLDKLICCRCGGDELEPNGTYITKADKYQSYQCKDCGGFSRNRTSSLTREERENLLVSTSK